GLYHDDVLFETPQVAEALNRLPQTVKDERNFRTVKALHLSMKKIILPKEEWVTLEEVSHSLDSHYFYLFLSLLFNYS
ncbi:UNVERIFIED_CONTAM: hypothetical protein GTU68_041761, partial [Idotea baltica]|nr:hypothetical protein [Idotea baltica]